MSLLQDILSLDLEHRPPMDVVRQIRVSDLIRASDILAKLGVRLVPAVHVFSILGMPVRLDARVPPDEAWLTDEAGKLIERVRLAEAESSF